MRATFFLYQRKDSIPHRIYMEICSVHDAESLLFHFLFVAPFVRFLLVLPLLLQWMHCDGGYGRFLWNKCSVLFAHAVFALSEHEYISCSWSSSTFGPVYHLNCTKTKCVLLFYCLIARPRNPVSLFAVCLRLCLCDIATFFALHAICYCECVCVCFSRSSWCGLFGKFVKWFLLHVEWFGKL